MVDEFREANTPFENIYLLTKLNYYGRSSFYAQA